MQATSTGHEPGVVRVPTVHNQETFPAPSAVFVPSPCASLGPLWYVTVMLQPEFAVVRAAAVAVPPRRIGLVTVSVTVCREVDAGVLTIAGAAVGAAVAVGGVGVEVAIGVLGAVVMVALGGAVEGELGAVAVAMAAAGEGTSSLGREEVRSVGDAVAAAPTNAPHDAASKIPLAARPFR